MFTCPMCTEKFLDILHLLSHYKNSHPEFGMLHLHLFKCDICTSISTNLSQMQEHYIKAHSLTKSEPRFLYSIQADMLKLNNDCHLCQQYGIKPSMPLTTFQNRFPMVSGNLSNCTMNLTNFRNNSAHETCNLNAQTLNNFKSPGQFTNSKVPEALQKNTTKNALKNEMKNLELDKSKPAHNDVSSLTSESSIESFEYLPSADVLNSNVPKYIPQQGSTQLNSANQRIVLISQQKKLLSNCTIPGISNTSSNSKALFLIPSAPVNYSAMRNPPSIPQNGHCIPMKNSLMSPLQNPAVSHSLFSPLRLGSNIPVNGSFVPNSSISNTLGTASFQTETNSKVSVSPKLSSCLPTVNSVASNTYFNQPRFPVLTNQILFSSKSILPVNGMTNVQTKIPHLINTSQAQYNAPQTKVEQPKIESNGTPKEPIDGKFPTKPSSLLDINVTSQSTKNRKAHEKKRLLVKVDDQTNFCSVCKTKYQSDLLFHNHELGSVPKGYIKFIDNQHFECTICCKTFAGVYYTLRHIALKHEFDWLSLKDKIKFCPKLKRKARGVCENIFGFKPKYKKMTNSVNKQTTKRRKSSTPMKLISSPNPEDIYDFDIHDIQAFTDTTSKLLPVSKKLRVKSKLRKTKLQNQKKTLPNVNRSPKKHGAKLLSKILKSPFKVKRPYIKKKVDCFSEEAKKSERIIDFNLYKDINEDTQPMTTNSGENDFEILKNSEDIEKIDDVIQENNTQQIEKTESTMKNSLHQNLTNSDSLAKPHENKNIQKMNFKKKNMIKKREHKRVIKNDPKLKYHTRNTTLKYTILPCNPVITSSFQILKKKGHPFFVKQEFGSMKAESNSTHLSNDLLPLAMKSETTFSKDTKCIPEIKTLSKMHVDQDENGDSDFNVEKLFTGSFKLEKTVNCGHVDYKDHLSSLSGTKSSSSQLGIPPSLNPEPEEIFFSCNFCERRFRNRLRIISHVRNQHFCGRTHYKLRHKIIKREKMVLPKCETECKKEVSENKACEVIHDSSVDEAVLFRAPLPPIEYISPRDSSTFKAILSMKEPPSIDLYNDHFEPQTSRDFCFNQCSFCFAKMETSDDFLQHLMINHPGFCRPRSMKRIPKIMLCKLD